MKTIIDGHTVELADDGTIDTVLVVDGKHTARFDSEYASSFREDDGSFTQEQFDELAKEAYEDFLWEDSAYEVPLPDKS